MRARVRTAAAVMTIAAAGLAATALPAASAQAYNPLNGLATGPAPAVPYAVGEQLHAFGRTIDLTGSFTAAGNPGGQVDTVVASRGVAWASFINDGGPCAARLGRVSPTLPWRVVATTSSACAASTDATAGGLATTADVVSAVTSAGQVYARYPRQIGRDVGPCIAGNGEFDTARAAGYRFVVTEHTYCSQVRGKFLWYPGGRPQQLPLTYDALGRLGTGWLGDAVAAQPSAECWRIAPATEPTALSKVPLCSLAVPLVSADGKRTVIVQGGRVRVVDTATGATVSVPVLGPVQGGWPFTTRYEVPAAWETSDAYLVDVRYDGALALVRCSMSSGHCVIAARSYVHSGVSDLVTERNATYALPRPPQ